MESRLEELERLLRLRGLFQNNSETVEFKLHQRLIPSFKLNEAMLILADACLKLERVLPFTDDKIEALKEDNTKLIEDHSQIVSDLTSTRNQLEAAQRACKKLKRRTAKELADLERVAEEQCNRASAFAEELALLRRNYTYLQARVRSYITFA